MKIKRGDNLHDSKDERISVRNDGSTLSEKKLFYSLGEQELAKHI